MGNILFTTTKNYMKRSPASGTYTHTWSGTSRFSGAWYTSEFTVAHEVDGKVPMFRLYYEPFKDGRIFEAFQDDQYYLSDPPNTYGGSTTAPTVLASADSTNITIRLFFTDNSFNGTDFTFYLVVYEDYGAA